MPGVIVWGVWPLEESELLHGSPRADVSTGDRRAEERVLAQVLQTAWTTQTG